ncbi:hypothetical protein H6G76_05760 [Nostoc sp. FACHB-152]|uniref:hypothetical protein n=1 Tax=unclassified Nostoc TaxID=2593658 RepID=UPI001686B2D2|nr:MULTISPECIES: hypothetical protein [unclassified Nostoc]MBD2446679.1 hypothetical protein [Nostoc sp. FACHB-152]MBD2466527.1 hypothetical protein [Nostoc sp. FACHB-145]
MLKLSYARNFFILISLFSLYANSSSIANAQESQQQPIVTGCKVNYDAGTRELKLVEPLIVNAQSSRARCIIRINTPNTQRQFRLVPLAFKGEVRRTPATVAVASLLIGGTQGIKVTRIRYDSPPLPSGRFDLTSQIIPTDYTNSGTFGLNVVLSSSGGEAQLTEMRFVLQQM